MIIGSYVWLTEVLLQKYEILLKTDMEENSVSFTENLKKTEEFLQIPMKHFELQMEILFYWQIMTILLCLRHYMKLLKF